MIVGDTGIVVPPHSFEKLAEAIGRLLDFGETERRQLGSMARDRIVLQFSIEKMVKSHEALYCRVLGIAMQERRLSTGLEGSGAE
jgi:glycosyltransferase involved in cell wall biosynthesis